MFYNYSALGGEKTFLDANIDAWKSCFTPDGMKYFSNAEQLLDYISEKCGKDVADMLKPLDSFAIEQLEELNEDTIMSWEEKLDDYDLKLCSNNGHINPVNELKLLRRIKKDYERAFEILKELSETITK